MKNKRKSLRVLITQECNLSCSYCCNTIEWVNNRFKSVSMDEVFYSMASYDNICITGGEPLLRPDIILDLFIKTMFFSLSHNTPPNFYLYTNGLLLSEGDNTWSLFDGINIGIHYKEQVDEILTSCPSILDRDNVRFYVEDKHKDEYMWSIPDRFIETWKMNECDNNLDQEDWFVLK